MNNLSLLNNFKVEYKVGNNKKIITLYDLSKIINIGETFNYAPLDIKILNIFINEVKSNLKNNSISFSLYGVNNQVRIFGKKT
jgi:hypothetical protein